MMWEIRGTPIDPQRFMPFEPLRVLNYYDGPRIFTLVDSGGSLCLACWSDETESRTRFLVVPTTDSIVAALEVGLLCVRDALTNSPLWVVDLSDDGTLSAAWSMTLTDVPEDAQPQPGIKLNLAAEPVLSTRVLA